VAAQSRFDVIIIGAGAAGLAALAELDKAGLNTLCLEARDRIGGRIFTIHDPACPLPIELGAEFIHGRPPETWNIIESARLPAYDCTENAVRIADGTVVDRAEAWLPVDDIMSHMEKAAQAGLDRSFRDFLAGTNYASEAKKLATSYVEGFNAAHDDRIGIASLAQDSRASGEIDGDRSFRLMSGYDAVPHYLSSFLQEPDTVRLNSIVERIVHKRGRVFVTFRSALTGGRETVEAEAAVVTLPLGVLQSGGVEFNPVPADHLQAASQLCFGHVFRVILRFRERLWDRNAQLSDAGFLLSDEPVFPTWWTPLPFRTPLITGWSAGRKSDPLLGRSREAIINSALDRLARITSLDSADIHSSLAAAYFHDWAADPFSRGAYSYVPVGGLSARQLLAAPIDRSLYFSGEATELNGHGATVHGAIASGRRSAREILGRA
jgi:monoamine oxidase